MPFGSDPTETFRQEAQDLLEQLEQALLDLEGHPDNRDLVDCAFRALHTIKGSGAMFGFETVAAFTHHVETAFDDVRKGRLRVSSELIALALAAQDHIRRLLGDPAADHSPRGNQLLEQLAALQAADGAVKVEPEPVHGQLQSWRIRFFLAQDAIAMGTNPLFLLDELRGLGTCSITPLTTEVPSLLEINPEGCYLGWDVLLTTAAGRDAIDDVFIFVRDDARLEITPVKQVGSNLLGEILVARGAVDRDTVEEAAEHRPKIGEILVETGMIQPEAVKAALAEQSHFAKDQKGGSVAAKEPGASLRVPAERLDELMDRVGELVIAQAHLAQLAAGQKDPKIKAVAEEIERLSSELRDTTMSIRMVPIGSLFGRFRRLVHDLSRDLGKEIRLVTTGEDTELDKTVIERLNDPLVHLIRNSADHGIEDAARRVAAGKPPEGELRLEAWHSGAQVVIQVSDDGNGLDRARIRAKAEEQGLVQPGVHLADDELLRLILAPGFSTAKEITNVSGRGVGMDVVKRNIEMLRGTIDVASRPGEGAEVTIRLPLTLAIIDGLLVRVGDGRYVIPLADVEECVELSSRDSHRSSGRSLLNIRGEMVPFVYLRELFCLGTVAEAYQKVVIVKIDDTRMGLVVDQIIGDHQTVIKSLSKLHADVAGFSGATILGDGTVALILDVDDVVEFAEQREERRKCTA